MADGGDSPRRWDDSSDEEDTPLTQRNWTTFVYNAATEIDGTQPTVERRRQPEDVEEGPRRMSRVERLRQVLREQVGERSTDERQRQAREERDRVFPEQDRAESAAAGLQRRQGEQHSRTEAAALLGSSIGASDLTPHGAEDTREMGQGVRDHTQEAANTSGDAPTAWSYTQLSEKPAIFRGSIQAPGAAED